MLDEISTAITISIPLLVLVLLELLISCGLESAMIKRIIEIILNIFNNGYSLDLKDLNLKLSDDDIFRLLTFLNLKKYIKNIMNGINSNNQRNSGFLKTILSIYKVN